MKLFVAVVWLMGFFRAHGQFMSPEAIIGLEDDGFEDDISSPVLPPLEPAHKWTKIVQDAALNMLEKGKRRLSVHEDDEDGLDAVVPKRLKDRAYGRHAETGYFDPQAHPEVFTDEGREWLRRIRKAARAEAAKSNPRRSLLQASAEPPGPPAPPSPLWEIDNETPEEFERFLNRTALAIVTGNSSAISGNELRRAIRFYLEETAVFMENAQRSIWNETGPITYNPREYGMALGITDTESAFPIMVTHWDFDNHVELTAWNAKRVLAAAGLSAGGLGGRFVAFGHNPMSLRTLGTANVTENLDKLLYNAIKWLKYGKNPADQTQEFTRDSPFKVVVAHLPNSNYNQFTAQDARTREWLRNNFTNIQINAPGTCENSELADCLLDCDLLILGRQQDRVDETATLDGGIYFPKEATTPVEAVFGAIANYSMYGGPIFYVDYNLAWWAPGRNNLSDAVLTLLGLPSFYQAGNYQTSNGLLVSRDTQVWGDAWGLYNVTIDHPTQAYVPSSLMLSVINTLTLPASKLNQGDFNFYNGAWQTCFNMKGMHYLTCPAGNMQNKLTRGLQLISGMLSVFDASGIDIWVTPKRFLPKLFVLLGDKYRQNATDPGTPTLSYPINITDPMDSWSGLAFADATVLYRRKHAPMQDDLGSLYCKRDLVRARTTVSSGCDVKTWMDKVPVYQDLEHKQPMFTFDGAWTSTGLFALPGRPFTVKRTDSHNGTYTNLYLFFQRVGVTKGLNYDLINGVKVSWWDRPQRARSHAIRVGPEPVTITAPYGGPIYIAMHGTVSAAVTPRPELVFVFSGVAKHPAVLDMSNVTQINALGAQVDKQNAKYNPIPFVDMRADGVEVHARVDKLTDAVGLSRRRLTTDFNSTEQEYGSIQELLDDYRFRFVETCYYLAGLKPPGKALSSFLSQPIKTICEYNQLTCTDELYNRPTNIQHSNYDQDANCGAGCSGNPWDAMWTISPIGWGESHEIGHNLQVQQLNMHGLKDGKQRNNTARNSYSEYVSTSGENSNNLFGIHTLWNYHRLWKNTTGYLEDYHHTNIDAFAIIQSGHADLTRSIEGAVRKVVFDSKCNIVRHFPTGTPADIAVGETIYGVYSTELTAAYTFGALNQVRQSFYAHLPYVIANERFADNKTALAHGFEIYPLLYSSIRYYNRIVGDDASWNGNRSKIGMDGLSRTEATGMPGNDFVLIVTSYLTGMDFRSYFEVRGLPFSDRASAQINRHRATYRIWRNATTDFACVGFSIPEVDVTKDVNFVKIDGASPFIDQKGEVLFDLANCLKCDNSVCEQCTGDGGCLKCNATTGHYITQFNDCIKPEGKEQLLTGCAVYTGNSTDEKTSCHMCEPSFLITRYGVSCLNSTIDSTKVIEGCGIYDAGSSMTGSTSCFQCNTTLGFYNLNNGTCVKLNEDQIVANCTHYTNTSTPAQASCAKCINDLYVSSTGKCVTAFDCPSEAPWGDVKTGLCSSLENCSKGTIFNATGQTCSICTKFASPTRHACYDLCPAGFYADTSLSQCLPCDASCQDCAGSATTCTTCFVGYFKNRDNRCQEGTAPVDAVPVRYPMNFAGVNRNRVVTDLPFRLALERAVLSVLMDFAAAQGQTPIGATVSYTNLNFPPPALSRRALLAPGSETEISATAEEEELGVSMTGELLFEDAVAANTVKAASAEPEKLEALTTNITESTGATVEVETQAFTLPPSPPVAKRPPPPPKVNASPPPASSGKASPPPPASGKASPPPANQGSGKAPPPPPAESEEPVKRVSPPPPAEEPSRRPSPPPPATIDRVSPPPAKPEKDASPPPPRSAPPPPARTVVAVTASMTVPETLFNKASDRTSLFLAVLAELRQEAGVGSTEIELTACFYNGASCLDGDNSRRRRVLLAGPELSLSYDITLPSPQAAETFATKVEGGDIFEDPIIVAGVSIEPTVVLQGQAKKKEKSIVGPAVGGAIGGFFGLVLITLIVVLVTKKKGRSGTTVHPAAPEQLQEDFKKDQDN